MIINLMTAGALVFWIPLCLSSPRIQTNKIPPVLLRPFRTTRDIRYSQYLVPKRTLFNRISFSLVIDILCSPENFTTIIRPHSLPIVTPFILEVPPSALVLSDYYTVNVNLQDNPVTDINVSPPGKQVFAWSSKSKSFASIEITIPSPSPGMWFFGSLFTDTSFNKGCKILVFAETSHELAPDLRHTVVFYKSLEGSTNETSSSIRTIRTVFSTAKTNGFSSTKKYSDAGSAWFPEDQQHRNKIRSFLSTGVTDTHSWSTRRSQRRISRDRRSNISRSLGILESDSNLYVTRSMRWPSENASTQEQPLKSNGPVFSLLQLRLNPLEGQLVQLLVTSGMTSVEMLLNNCQPIPNPRLETPILNTSKSTPLQERRSSPAINQTFTSYVSRLCKLVFETSIDSLPLSLASAMRHNSVDDIRNTSEDHIPANNPGSFKGSESPHLHERASSTSISVPWKEGERYRFDSLQTPDVAHYLYLQNLHETSSLELVITFSPIFGCDTDDQLNRADKDEYHPPVRERVQQLDATTNVTESKENTPNSSEWSVSLLPWLNASWPELTPERGRRRLMRKKSMNYLPLSGMNLVVDPRDPAHQLLRRCLLWSAPSRISMPQAFASHFTYQPNSGRYTSGFQLQAWQVIVLPIELDSRTDSGGTLEISLQLNAFAVTRLVNNTHSQPLLRQVVLHGCFARHVTTTPFGFVNPERCPVWLRLATDRGLAISVAHSVSIVASAVLSRSQPPHRSEVPPAVDTSFDDRVDRSFLYLPYPTPGQWYLSLYAECYPIDDPLCSRAPAASIDVGLVLRLTPCLNYRCRDIGEGASLPPSRVLNASLIAVRPFIERPPPTIQSERWRPPWLIPGLNVTSPRQSPLFLPSASHLPDNRPLAGEGLCVELLQRSIFASTCACPPGRAGLGCMRYPRSVLDSTERPLSAVVGVDDGLDYVWSGHSSDALLLALSNLAFLPAIGLALLRRLWIPALAYTYTLVFSALYHICDTDVMNIPNRLGATTIGGAAMSFGGYALPKSRGYEMLGSEPSGYRSTSTGFRFTSPICPLPLDVLSFCDFFGGVLSVWVTVVAATACPLRYAQLAYVMFVLSLTVAVQVARYSTGLFLIPCLIGLVMLIGSWTYRSRRTGRLFPPVQWWLISFFPGLLLAGIGLILFLSPWMSRDYARVHSLWHIVIGLSLLGLLPWPRRWRIALAKVVSVQTPLSCGGDQFIHLHAHRSRRGESIRSHRSRSPASNPLNGPNSEDQVTSFPVDSTKSSMHQTVGRIFACSRHLACRMHRAIMTWCDKLDVWLELDRLLDPMVARWPKLDWLLPNGYIPGRSRVRSVCLNSVLPPTTPNGPIPLTS